MSDFQKNRLLSDFHLYAELMWPHHGSHLAPPGEVVSELKLGSVHCTSHLTCYNVRRTGSDRYFESKMGHFLLVQTNQNGCVT